MSPAGGGAAGLHEAIRRMQQAAGRPLSNWFAAPEQASRWAARGTLSYQEGPEWLLIERRDGHFRHLYHIAANLEALGAALAARGAGPTTSDIVGREEDVRAAAGVYEAHGFTRHTSLVRLSRVTTAQDAEIPLDPSVEFAGDTDLPQVTAFLGRLLDRFRDQIPDVEEFREAAERHNLLLVRDGPEPGGVLLFEPAGLTSHLRYWYVDPAFQNRGIGARLIRAFFRLSCGARRLILWVVQNNTDAILKYHHYGFRAESLVDWIMIDKEETR